MKSTPVVVVTNQYDPDADMVMVELNRRSINVIRFNTEDFPTKISFTFDPKGNEMDFLLPMGRVIHMDTIKSIWYRRPIPCIIDSVITNDAMRIFAGREAQTVLDSFYQCFGGFWMSHPLKIRAASRKIHQLRLAQQLGLAIPPTLVTTDPLRAKQFYQEHREVIVKAMSAPVIEAEAGFYSFSTAVIDEISIEKLDCVRLTPTLFQAYIPKKLELRVTVVGEIAFTCEIYSQSSEKSRVDWRFFDPDKPVPHKAGKLPEEIERKIIEMVKILGLSFAAIDMILTPSDEYIFLEINPNGQWAWIEPLTGMPISKAIADLLVNGGNRR